MNNSMCSDGRCLATVVPDALGEKGWGECSREFLLNNEIRLCHVNCGSGGEQQQGTLLRTEILRPRGVNSIVSFILSSRQAPC